MSKVHIGCGAGFSGDRFDAALPILEDMKSRSGPRYLVYEVLAERTLALAQTQRKKDASKGYSPYLDNYLRLSLKAAKDQGVRIVSNIGAANPLGAGHAVQTLARELGIKDLSIAVVLGDDLLRTQSEPTLRSFDTMEGIPLADAPLIAANAYLGARPIAKALATGADIVLVGRTTDSALFLGPLIHEFGWSEADLDLLATGTICGHLLECGGQVSGTYFADPGFKDVPDLANAGFPIAEITAAGELTITKPQNTGGCVTPATVTEQLLYEMHNPAAYLVPDCIADVSNLSLTQTAPNRVKVSGIKGHSPPPTLKATLCTDAGWLAEAELSYAGPNALARVRLAADIIRQRLDQLQHNHETRIEILGTGAILDAANGTRSARATFDPNSEYRLRAAGRRPDLATAKALADEVLSLYCSGPAGGGGYRRQIVPELATASILIPREHVEPHVTIEVLST